MEKSIVYIVGAFAIVTIICALAMPSSSSTSSTTTTQTQAPNIQIGTADVTTNIWDYIRSRNTTTIGDSDSDTTLNATTNDEPTLTIVLD